MTHAGAHEELPGTTEGGGGSERTVSGPSSSSSTSTSPSEPSSAEGLEAAPLAPFLGLVAAGFALAAGAGGCETGRERRRGLAQHESMW